MTGIAIISVIIGIGIGYVIGITDDPPDPPDTSIKRIGLILPLTGDLETHGNENWEASKLAERDFNNYLKENDAQWSLKLLSEDSATQPDVAREKLNNFYAEDIKIIVGLETSENVKKIREYEYSNEILLVSCCSSAISLANAKDNLFRLVPSDDKQGEVLAKLIKHEGIEAIVPLWRGDTWGEGLRTATTASFLELNGTVDNGIRYTPDDPEYDASLSLLNKTVQDYINNKIGAEKVGVLFLGFGEILQFVQSAHEYDVLNKVKWYGPGAITKEQKLTDDPSGFFSNNNAQLTTIQVAVTKNPTYEKVKAELKEILVPEREPSNFAYSSYDAVWIIGLAMLETNSTNVSKITSIIPSIAAKYAAGDFVDPAIGNTTLNAVGDLVQADYEIWGIRGGDWEHLGDYTQAKDSITWKT